MVGLLSRRRVFRGLSPGAPPLGAPPPRGRGGGRAGVRRRARLAALLSSVIAVGLCALAACALFVPGFVLGAEPPAAGPDGRAAAVAPAIDPKGAAISQIAPSAGVLLVTLPWGGGDGQVGLLAPGEGLARGPEALAVAPDGRIAVLDSVNKRLVLLDARGRSVGTAPVALSEPRFLAADNDRLYVLDCDVDRRLVTLDWSGVSLAAAVLPELDDVVTGLFSTDVGPCVEVAHESVFLINQTDSGIQTAATASNLQVASTGPAKPLRAELRALAGRPLDRRLGRVAKVTFKPGKNAEIRLSSIDKKSLKAKQTAELSAVLAPGRALEHVVSVDGDGSGGLLVGARLLDTDAKGAGRPSLIISRLSSSAAAIANQSAGTAAAGTAGDSLLLADSPFAYLGQPYVVAPDGRVFQPVADPNGYSILVHTFAGPAEVKP